MQAACQPSNALTTYAGMYAGPGPTAAVRLLHQLRLFDQVFTPPPEVQQLLGSEYGRPCVEVMAAAEALLQELRLDVSQSNACCLHDGCNVWLDTVQHLHQVSSAVIGCCSTPH